MRILRAVVGVLTSTRVAIGLMAVLAALSLAGAVVPQGEEAGYYVRTYGGLFGGLIRHLALGSVFHTAYFAALLVALCVMVAACSLKGLPARVRAARPRQFISDADAILRMEPSARLVVDLDQEEAELHAADILRKRLYSVRSRREGEARLLVGSKLALARFGSVILHLSFIFLLAGGIASTRLGERAYQTTRVGEAFDLDAGAAGVRRVTVENFDVEIDEGENISDFLCDVAVRDSAGSVTRSTIRPNHPLKVGPREIFLVSYKQDETVPEGFVVAVVDSAGAPVVPHLYVPVAEPVRVEEIGASARAVAGVVPGVTLIYDDGTVETQALTRSARGAAGDALNFIVMRAVPSVLVTLEVVKEPGQGLVMAGLVLLTLGAFGSLYLSHRSLWLVLRPAGGGKTEVFLGARASRNRDGLAREFEGIRRTLDELA